MQPWPMCYFSSELIILKYYGKDRLIIFFCAHKKGHPFETSPCYIPEKLMELKIKLVILAFKIDKLMIEAGIIIILFSSRIK